MDELVRDFLVETVEALAVLDNDLVRLEAEPGNTALIAGIFRALHTIKGTCGFLGLAKLGRVAHAGENVLGRLRDASLAATPAVVNAILCCVDAIKGIAATIEATGAEGDTDYSDLLSRLDAIYQGEPAGQAEADQSGTEDLAPAPAEPAGEDPAPVPVAASDQAIPAAPVPASGTAAGNRESAVANQTVRVSIDLLEGLMTTVSELVLTRNQLLQLLRSEQESAFGAPLQHLSMITSELQESVMKARMQPIGNAWTALPRIVRDLAYELGKRIELVMEGADTELDRQVLELIKDPLTHMIRNSADHGLEMPAERRAAGKDETGRIRLTAFHEGGHIIIQVSDDGHGLDVERIRRKAVQNGLATEADAAAMPDAQVFRFIMRPGFSTAAAVTSVSGRGVGMDVVRANIEKIGGTIDIASQPGRGATFTIKIPLTLAIISALIVGCSGERFAVPQISVVELVRASKDGEHRIERIKQVEVLRLRNHLLPLINLRNLLALGSGAADEGEQLVIVTQAGNWRFGIVVDHVYDTEEIVVKPVVPLLKSLGVYSGNTILGDGSVCMILDPVGLVGRTGQLDGGSEDMKIGDRSAENRRSAQDSMRLLLVRAGQGMRKAIPLDLVARIEEIDVSAIHRSDDRLLVHYGERLMPVTHAADDVVVREAGKQPMLVFTEQASRAQDGSHLDRRSRQMGVLVDQIVDIVDSAVQLQIDCSRPDLIGSALVNGMPTEVLNAAYYLERCGDWAADRQDGSRDDFKRALLADDSPFFRNLIASTLQVAGVAVQVVTSAEDALASMQSGMTVDMVLTSTEMPGMSGYELARRLRQDAKGAVVPVIGLSAQLTERETERGKEAGFVRHFAKLDQKRLLEAVRELLQDEEPVL